MRRWHWLWGLWLLVVSLTACNGSGSSGFDGRGSGGPTEPPNPRIDDSVFIRHVLTTESCVDRRVHLLCPLDVVTPLPYGPYVLTDLPTPQAITCVPDVTGEECRFTFMFFPYYIPADTVFRVAIRPQGLRGRWRLGPPPRAVGTPEAPAFEVTVSVPRLLAPRSRGTDENGLLLDTSMPLTTPEGPTVHVALLLWINTAVTGKTEFASLLDSHADWVFATELQLDIPF